MDEELKVLIENHTWDLMPCLTNVKPIEGKWVYSVNLMVLWTGAKLIYWLLESSRIWTMKRYLLQLPK